MAWVLVSPPIRAWATTQDGTAEILAIRVESATGATEFLLAGGKPGWVAMRDIEATRTADDD